jgi:hypothetical protein
MHDTHEVTGSNPVSPSNPYIIFLLGRSTLRATVPRLFQFSDSKTNLKRPVTARQYSTMGRGMVLGVLQVGGAGAPLNIKSERMNFAGRRDLGFG